MPAVINFKTDPATKAQAQVIAKKMGLNLSNVLNVYLKTFVKEQKLETSLTEDERTDLELLALDGTGWTDYDVNLPAEDFLEELQKIID